MEVAFIDLGRYSVKFLRGIVERRSVQYLSFEEKTIRKALSQLMVATEESEGEGLDQGELIELVQFKLIEGYLEQTPSVEKVVINLPSHYSILRFVSLPIKGKKKIERMLPFQLEDELPYPITNAHLAFYPISNDTGTYAITQVGHVKKFGHFFQRAQELIPHPQAIIGIESVYQALYSQLDISSSTAIIDLGHLKTTCYLFSDGKLTGVESSFICGKTVDEAIAKTYQIDTDEAIAFKHKSSFFLTEEQFEGADQDQKNFSQVMEETFSGLVDDFKRWHIGHQLKTRQSLKRVLLTGGLANIKNLDNFLGRQLGVPVSHFNYWQQTRMGDLNISHQEFRSLAVCHGLSHQLTTKNGLSNFCNGDFAVSGADEFPLPSISFVGVRVAMACLLLFVALVVESLYLSRSDKKVSQQLTKELKDPFFLMTPSERRKLLRKPDELLLSLREKGSQLNGQIAVLEEISGMNGIGPLVKLGKDIKQSRDVELISFENQTRNVRAVFKAESFEILQKLERSLRGKHDESAQITLKKEEKTLELSYNDIQEN